MTAQLSTLSDPGYPCIRTLQLSCCLGFKISRFSSYLSHLSPSNSISSPSLSDICIYSESPSGIYSLTSDNWHKYQLRQCNLSFHLRFIRLAFAYYLPEKPSHDHIHTRIHTQVITLHVSIYITFRSGLVRGDHRARVDFLNASRPQKLGFSDQEFLYPPTSTSLQPRAQLHSIIYPSIYIPTS